jgi:uncharacterized protein
LEPIALVALLVGGLIAGIINSMAGGGSLITLPLLVFAGLPPTVANGTNRVAVVVQCVTAVFGFARSGYLPRPAVARTAMPTVLGALIGAFVASHLSDAAFRPILGVVLLVMAGVVALKPSRWLGDPGASPRPMRPALFLAFFAAGAYGGFIQAGVGFLLLAALVPGMGLDLVRANGVKVALALVLTVMALGVFVVAGQVDWRAGGVLAVGNGIGGYVGARLAVRLGAPWIRWVLFAMVAASALEILGVRTFLFGSA